MILNFIKNNVSPKVAKIRKLGYIQFMNDNNNNFSLIRNGEINRLGPIGLDLCFMKCRSK